MTSVRAESPDRLEVGRALSDGNDDSTCLHLGAQWSLSVADASDTYAQPHRFDEQRMPVLLTSACLGGKHARFGARRANRLRSVAIRGRSHHRAGSGRDGRIALVHRPPSMSRRRIAPTPITNLIAPRRVAADSHRPQRAPKVINSRGTSRQAVKPPTAVAAPPLRDFFARRKGQYRVA